MLRKYLYLAVALLFLGITLLWSLYLAPQLKKIPNTFSYTAEILSLDNFYDEQLHKFEGQQISKTLFSYKVLKAAPNILTIENRFDVRKINDEPIFSVTRTYAINPYNGQHVAQAGIEPRSGTLFAPRYSNKQGFDYWHINYDAPAHMIFLHYDLIDHLTVAHYQAKYHADQTKNLTGLPDVATTRGIKTNILLDLWVEPISGWLVKYQDHTLAYYYDKKTGARLNPWNKFSNRYTENSIHQQIQNARYLKWNILIIDFIVPMVLLLISLACFLVFYLELKKISLAPWTKKIGDIGLKRPLIYSTGLVVICLLLGSFAYIYYQSTVQKIALIGISEWNDNPEYQEAIKGFKDGLAAEGFEEGKSVAFLQENPHANIERQIKVIQNFLNKKVNLMFVLTTPGTIIAKGITKQTPIVFSVVTYPKEANLIDSIASSHNNLVGSCNYISPALQYRAFEELFPHTKVLGFVHHKGEPNSSIQLAEYQSMLNRRGIKVIDIAAIDLSNLQQLLEQYKNQYNALFLACDTLVQSGGGALVADFARKNKIPSFGCSKNTVMQGALIGYVADFYAMGKEAGGKAALILKGAEPSWLHTGYPERGYIVINLLTAKQLGITIPSAVLKTTDYLVGREVHQ